MFDSLKHFLRDLSGDEVEREFDDNDYRLAAAALLVHLAEADGETDEAEKLRLKEIVQSSFGLDSDASARLIASAQRSDHEAVDFYHFTNVLRRALNAEGRLRIVEMMWELAFADGAVDELEENIVWRIAALLEISNHDRIALRQRVAEELHREPPRPGPWSKPGR